VVVGWLIAATYRQLGKITPTWENILPDLVAFMSFSRDLGADSLSVLIKEAKPAVGTDR
jgi:hypothetical protein